MTELAIEMKRAPRSMPEPRGGALPPGFTLSHWDATFTDALLRLVQLVERPTDAAVLGDGRLREVYYAALTGEAGATVRRAFGVGNEIARVIEHVSSNLHEVITIEEMAAPVGMSKAVFHRKFKEATHPACLLRAHQRFPR